MGVLRQIRLKHFRNKWRKQNKHNLTTANYFFDMNCVTVGKGTYGELRVQNDLQNLRLDIGCYCSIAADVVFLLGQDHETNYISTYPFKVLNVGLQEVEAVSKGNIIVKDDVWIGYGAKILSGVTIGQGAVVATGSVVTKDVPAYSIVGGIPAKVIKYRFSDTIIEKLLKIDFKNISDDMIKNNLDKLYEIVDEDTDFSWLPQKNE